MIFDNLLSFLKYVKKISAIIIVYETGIKWKVMVEME